MFANLQGTNLGNANLQEAGLDRANFEGEAYSNLAGADLSRANLQNANLSDAKLSDVTGLLADNLAGANLSNAKLPEDIAKFEALDHVAEISKHARNNFLAVLGACVFSWLTIATTTDAALLANRSETALPIIGTKIPIAGFYWAAPFILLSLYVYLHIYLQKLWEGLAKLPAIFQDGAALNDKAYPWLLTCLTYLYVPRLRDRRPALWWLQVSLSVVAAWMLVPVTLWLFWWRYVPRFDWLPAHGPALTFVQFFMVVLSIWIGTLYYQIAHKAFVGYDGNYCTWRTNGSAMVCVVLLAWFAYYFTFFVDHHSYADFAKGEYSGADFELGNFAGANFRAANLQGANLAGANLQGADLRLTKLKWANLYFAKLQGARLWGANLQGADLYNAGNLTREQLDAACGDDETTLPDHLADYKMKPCPTPAQPPSN